MCWKEEQGRRRKRGYPREQPRLFVHFTGRHKLGDEKINIKVTKRPSLKKKQLLRESSGAPWGWVGWEGEDEEERGCWGGGNEERDS